MLPWNKEWERTKKLQLKPWVTKGIKTFIKVRDKSYKEPIKEKNSQRKLKKSETYEKYQNKFVDLLKVSKQAH